MNNSIFAVDNYQYIVSVDDSEEIIEGISYLYVKSNYALPSMSAPYSVAELINMLEQINYNSLNKVEKKTYDYLEKKILSFKNEVKENVDFNIGAELNFEGYSHTNTTDFIERDTWFRGWTDQENLFNLNLEFLGDDFAYALSSISFGVARLNDIPFGSSTYQTNIPGYIDLDFYKDTNSVISQKAFASFGDSNWNLQIGRDKLNWGAGLSGNLLLSDNLKYQDFGKFTMFGDKYKYTYLASFFPHQLNYIKTDGFSLNTSQLDPVVGFSMFVVHKFEGRAFNNRLGWSFAEGLMYASEDSSIDVSAFNPMLSYHSLFYKANCNSIVSLDLDYTINSSTNVYSQIVIDDLVVPSLETSSIYSPNAIGLMLGAKYFYANRLFNLQSNIEFVYTSPYLYLRDDGTTSISEDSMQDGYGINFIVALREFSNTSTYSGITYDKEFLGYKYGGDALVFNHSNKFNFFNNKLTLETNYFLMLHGVNSIDTLWSPVGGNVDDPGFLSLISYDGSLSGLSLTEVFGIYSDLELT
ncbi:MAG: hypothetical protein ACPKM0_00080, partial [Pleomorphochaeta sp.]